jgi:hypothetical protein
MPAPSKSEALIQVTAVEKAAQLVGDKLRQRAVVLCHLG